MDDNFYLINDITSEVAHIPIGNPTLLHQGTEATLVGEEGELDPKDLFSYITWKDQEGHVHVGADQEG
eukprot:3526450-Prorocentrum_lima.AAC.1